MLEIAMMHGDHDGMGDMDGWMAGWMLVWLLVGIAVFALVVAGTIWLVRNMTGPKRTDDALRELDMRYARGELTSEEYDERRQRISVE